MNISFLAVVVRLSEDQYYAEEDVDRTRVAVVVQSIKPLQKDIFVT